MKQHLTILTSLVLALAMCVPCLTAADKPSATARGRKDKKPDAVETTPETPLDKQSRKKVQRAHHLAEKIGNNEFLNSRHGIAFKEQIVAVEQETNAVYERYLNIWREDPATEKGKRLREERDGLLRALAQKRKKIEADYESLKQTSPAYRAMVEDHLKNQLKQLKGKLKPESPKEKDADKQ